MSTKRKLKDSGSQLKNKWGMSVMFSGAIKELRSVVHTYWRQRAQNADRIALDFSKTISKLNDINDFRQYIVGVQSAIQQEFRHIEKRSEEMALANRANNSLHEFIIRMNQHDVLPTKALISAGFPYPHRLKPQSVDDLKDNKP